MRIQIAVLVILLLLGCSNDKVEPIKLAFGLDSALSAESVKSRLKSEITRWDLIEATQLGKDDKRPEFNFQIISITGLSYEGYSGETKLQFYNDKLMSIQFYPEKWEEYSKQIESVIGRSVTWKNERVSLKGVSIQLNVDLTGKHYLSWEDNHLVKKYESWLSKYS